MTRVSRSAAWLAAALALAGTTSLARADTVGDLVERYRSVSGRHDDFAYDAQREALDALADIASEASRRAIRRLIEDERGANAQALDRRRLVLLLSALVRRGGPEEVDAVIRVVESERDAFVTASLSRIVASVKEPAALAHVRGPALSRATPALKAQIARALGGMHDKEAVVPLLAVLREADVEVRAEALFALGELRDEAAFAPMTVFLGGDDARVREVAARALGILGTPRAVPALIRALSDAVPRVAESAANALGILGSPAAVTPLIDRLAAVRGNDLRLEEAFERALSRLTGNRHLGADADLWRAWWKENKDKVGPDSPRPEAPITISGPRYYGFPVRSSRVTFVVDVSRSMSWNGRLETAQKELKQVLEHLPSATRFNVLTYSDAAFSWAERLVPATPENIRRAVRHVERLTPVSGTNIYDGLRLAMRDEDVDSIYFLSDGSPTMGPIVDPDSILAEVSAMNRWRRVRIHTVALVKGDPPAGSGMHEDADRAAAFMKRLAEANDGTFREVR